MPWLTLAFWKERGPLLAILAAIVVAIAAFGYGLKLGEEVGKKNLLAYQATQKDHLIRVQEVIIKEVPRIITKYIQTTTTVETSHDHLVQEVDSVLDVHCTMPRGFAELLIAFANSATGPVSDPGSPISTAGTYGCRETAKALGLDLRSGYINTARLEGLQAWVKAKQLAEKSH